VAYLLHIDSSARNTGSVSRQLTAEFAARWRADHPDGRVMYRDLVTDALPHGKAATVAVMRTSEQARAMAQEEQLVAELAAADTLLIGAPMYNFRIPSSLKDWLDLLALSARATDQDLFGETCVVIASARRSACAPGIRHEASNHQERHLAAILGFIGLNDISFVRAPVEATANGKLDRSPFVPFPGKLLVSA
jgi:FMN-dependent NADH-azoreductase